MISARGYWPSRTCTPRHRRPSSWSSFEIGVTSGEEAVVGTGWRKMKLKFLLCSFAIALVQIAQLNAQSVLTCSSLHQETRRRRRNACRKNRRGLACFCHDRRYRGAVFGRRLHTDHRRRNQRQFFPRRNQYQPAPDEKPSPDNAVEFRAQDDHRLCAGFTTLTAADVGFLSGDGTGILGRYTRIEDDDGPRFGSADLPKLGPRSLAHTVPPFCQSVPFLHGSTPV